MATISVIIPTYKRVKDLERCLRAADRQDRKADEILVIARDTDRETLRFVGRLDGAIPGLRLVTVSETGVVAALNAGLDAAAGDFIAITDDDTAPRPDWLARIERWFEEDSSIGGIGGRDWVHHNGITECGSKRVVGKIQWFGRVIGNHHLGTGGPREVDVLKGANMSYRRSAVESIRFEACLKGRGAQVCNDMGFSMAVKAAGWKLLYDPEVAVDHYPSLRYDEDKRNSFHVEAQFNAAHNETYILLTHLTPFLRWVYLAWSVIVGTATYPGLLQWARLRCMRKATATDKWLATMRGRTAGVRTWRANKEGSA